jgi:glycosyltransferase involved in cell wall biosynthesis
MRLLFVCPDMHRGGAERHWATLIPALARPGAVITRTVSPQLVGQAIARRAGAVHVFNEHTPLTPAGELLEMRPRQRLLTRLVAPHVDRVVAVSGRQAAPLERLGYRGDRIATVPNGVFASDVERHVDRAAMRASLGLEEREFAVLCLANLRP